jgi:hypothetical protein
MTTPHADESNRAETRHADLIRTFLVGRSLSDFPDLNRAERHVIEAVGTGRWAELGEKIPCTQEEIETRTIRADLVRFLALGGDSQNPVHERGVRIRGAIIAGRIDLTCCTLSGDLHLQKCRLEDALTLDGARAKSLNLDGSDCKRICADGAHFDGDISFSQGFIVARGISLIRTAVAGNVDFSNAHICHVPSPDSVRNPAVIMAHASVGGSLVLGRNFDRDGKKGDGANFEGGVSLVSAKIGRIIDLVNRSTKNNDGSSGDKCNPSFLRIDGCIYERFGGDTDVSSQARIAFLKLQERNSLELNFKPQPWLQMIKVLRKTGHVDAARDVAIAYEFQRGKAKHITTKSGRCLRRIYGLFVGYGHRPMRLVYIALGVWLACAAIYFGAARYGIMAPTNPIVFDNSKHENCRPEKFGNWTACDSAPYEYTTFISLIYSLDLLLPLVDLQQEKDWAPMMQQPCASTWNAGWVEFCRSPAAGTKSIPESVATMKPAYSVLGSFVWAAMWMEILFGWAASLALAAVLAGLVKRID